MKYNRKEMRKSPFMRYMLLQLVCIILVPKSICEAQIEDDWGKPFIWVVRFRGEGEGPLIAKAPPSGNWVPDAKVLYVRKGELVYDIGWLGERVSDGIRVDDNNWHIATLSHADGKVKLYVDGKLVTYEDDFGRPDRKGHILKIGTCSDDFPELDSDTYEGEISHAGTIDNSLTMKQLQKLDPRNQAAASWSFWQSYDIESQADSDASESNINSLRDIDHAGIIRSWDEETILRGQRIYDAVCISCHGNFYKEGSLPTSRKFWEAKFKNGNDPYRLFQTLEEGFQQMPAFAFLSVQQRYDVIHYLREKLVKPTNRDEYFDITNAYLEGLPKGKTTGRMTKAMLEYAKGPKYMKMNFGPMLNWTYQVAYNNIAYKAIAVRLDKGAGGISKGRAWQVYDHDTMRVAAAWSGDEFIDWKGIALDQSHGTHASIEGEIAFTNPVGPGWANPLNGTWEDPRFLGRDGKPYGPLPREWLQFRGQYLYKHKVIIHYTIGDANVLELPGMEWSDANIIYTRTLNIGKSSHDLQMRIAPDDIATAFVGKSAAQIISQNGFHVLQIPADQTPLKTKLLMGKIAADKLHFQAQVSASPEDLITYIKGGPARFPEHIITEGKKGKKGHAFEVDEISYPAENPWNSWMRLGGFDFMSGGKRAAVATWLGDVWLVDGIDEERMQHRWKRICTGLFQPLGVKVIDDIIYITCRDQIARLHDYNGDEEIDYIECFNSDHQVTEHFHEFAMGLQCDEEGNFYYAKSARHAKDALVPHHGTLLKVSADGERTEIVAKGFRAANGVCLNPDGSFIVTDQEGHWNPKNRINYVRKGGFYGNMMAYHNITDERDEAMEQPICWITNAFDRSPGELLWIPEWANWGALNGQLINMSYGMGQVFLVPHEIINGQAQGGMVSLGLEFPTGIMRGRFHPQNGQLYTTGMFAWAGNKHQDGGFYRIRYTGKAVYQIIELNAYKDGLQLQFSDRLDPQSASNIENFNIKTWHIKRTKHYGSRHYNERKLHIEKVLISADCKRVFLKIPKLVPTLGMEIRIDILGAYKEPIKRIIHNTIHHLQETPDFWE